ncbi:hypothetical protein CW749_26795 [Vibrio sp. vnigr-6D03]|uniref:hypothetical protein n=1 Tax=Vibrio sp. vnigr-6D03 TaxID=2058088 RepID=UPI000C33A131|nr:hypothetical protein [Vibrio sp. vnigr-6D03]PKF76536.1 hypothetical protein CW749_26795 [Vibrio sp. vnigr-6D03]
MNIIRKKAKAVSTISLLALTVFGSTTASASLGNENGDIPLGTWTLLSEWSVPLSYNQYNQEFGWGISGPFFPEAENTGTNALVLNPDGSPALYLLENLDTSVTIAGKEVTVATFDVHQANRPTSSPSKGNVGDWSWDDAGQLEEDFFTLFDGSKNYCQLFPSLPVTGVWNSLWGSHSMSVGVGGDVTDDVGWGLSVTGSTRCDGVHNGYGAAVTVGASISTGLGEAMELAQAPIPVKLSFDVGGNVSLTAEVGGGYGGYFENVPHPLTIAGIRVPEYMYVSVTPAAAANVGGKLVVGMGLEGFLKGSANLLRLSLPTRLESGLTRAANPKNWKGYVWSNANFTASAGGGSFSAGVSAGVSPFSWTIWQTTLVRWSPLLKYTLPLYDDFVKFKLKVEVNDAGEATGGSMNDTSNI